MSDLDDLIAEELSRPVDPRVVEMAAALAACFPGSARAVLFYGSCLRQQQLEGLMLDFYLIVSDYRGAYAKRWLAIANRLLPPNVFPFVRNGLSAKYAVLSEADFARECSPLAGSVSVFARFAQPTRLVWSADEGAREFAVTSVSSAVTTLLRLTRAAISDEEASDPLDVWRTAFTFTYAAELRAERSSRPSALVDADPDRYAKLAEMAGWPGWSGVGQATRNATRRRWRQLRWRGKTLTILRLMKASFTFANGIDYLAWKINRHAGTEIALKPWQRRWPLLGAVTLLPRLLARGAIR
jgi:hypothetical protein